jgi:heptosyltransferase I
LRYGLAAPQPAVPAEPKMVAFVHGTSREDKCWPPGHWQALGERLIQAGYAIALPHGSEAERERSEALARALGPCASVWPRLDLAALTQRLAGCAGVIGVDSGLSHIAVALDLPHVQIYNFDTAWRTGPVGSARQQSLFAQPTPSVDAVWQVWQGVSAA